MKVRNNFVSNSSSTSFVILFHKDACASVEGFSLSVRSFLDMIENCSTRYCDETEIRCLDKDELILRYKNYEWADQNDKNVLDQLIDSDGFEAASFCISNHNPVLRDLLLFLNHYNAVRIINEQDE